MTKPGKNGIIKRIALWTVPIYAVLFSLRLVFSSIDYARVDGGDEPLFAIQTWATLDGGTGGFSGLGYEIIQQTRIHFDDKGNEGYMYGPILTSRWNFLFFPFAEKQNLRFVTTEQLLSGNLPRN